MQRNIATLKVHEKHREFQYMIVRSISDSTKFYNGWFGTEMYTVECNGAIWADINNYVGQTSRKFYDESTGCAQIANYKFKEFYEYHRKYEHLPDGSRKLRPAHVKLFYYIKEAVERFVVISQESTYSTRLGDFSWHLVTPFTFHKIMCMIVRIWTNNDKNFAATVGALRNHTQYEPEFHMPAWHKVRDNKFASPSPYDTWSALSELGKVDVTKVYIIAMITRGWTDTMEIEMCFWPMLWLMLGEFYGDTEAISGVIDHIPFIRSFMYDIRNPGMTTPLKRAFDKALNTAQRVAKCHKGHISQRIICFDPMRLRGEFINGTHQAIFQMDENSNMTVDIDKAVSIACAALPPLMLGADGTYTDVMKESDEADSVRTGILMETLDNIA